MALFKKKPSDPIAESKQTTTTAKQKASTTYQQSILSLRDILAPPSFEINSAYLKIGTRLVRTIYVYGFPRQIFTGWLSPVINLDEVFDMSLHIYPAESEVVLGNLKKKVAQLEASNQINAEKGLVRDPGLEASIQDAEELRDKLQVGEERFFRFGLYLTLYGDTLEHLNQIQRKIEGIFGQSLVYTKPTTLQMEQGFNSTMPQGTDKLQISRNMDTGALSTTFPFTSANLSQKDGVLYGINRHNNSLVIFDRFSLENANMVVFAKSGAGKSFAVKLEALRSLMMGLEVIVIDPEEEYRLLCNAVGGSYLELSLASDTRINPFDLPHVLDNEDADNALRANIITLHGLLRLMMGGAEQATEGGGGAAREFSPITPTEDADLDVALINTYAKAGITNDPLTHGATPPTMNDLYNTLNSMSGNGPALAARLRRYVSGTFAGIFSQQSNVDLDNKFVVFNIRDLEDELRPVAMYIILNHIWNRVKSDLKKRLLIVDEAWQLMRYEDSANFMFSLAKRARKYYLGLTTISQDVEDFLSSRMGRAIVANSSLQLLLKQAPSAADIVADTFKLTEAEKKRLTQFPVGEGLFFAGLNHVVLEIVASPNESQLITTNPEELLQESYGAETPETGEVTLDENSAPNNAAESAPPVQPAPTPAKPTPTVPLPPTPPPLPPEPQPAVPVTPVPPPPSPLPPPPAPIEPPLPPPPITPPAPPVPPVSFAPPTPTIQVPITPLPQPASSVTVPVVSDSSTPGV